MYRTFILFLLALLSLSAPSWATVIYVSGDQTGTWSADTVIVTAEVRVPPSMSLTILPGVEVLFSVYCKLIVDNGATLRAVGTAADSIRFDVLPPNVNWHGIRFLSASDSSRLEYCHLTHGYATGGGEDGKGGAIYCSNSSPTISHNTFSENSAASGGGIYCYNSSPSISGNIISDNSGGGISCWNNSSPTISANTISENSALDIGGGIYCYDSSPVISGNIVGRNSAPISGGGIFCYNSSPVISGNIITRNQAGQGGGIYCYTNSSPSISGNTISDNTAGNYGGGIYCNNSSPSIMGNTISGNSAGSGGGIECANNSNPTISGNTISGNSAGSGGGIYCTSSTPTISGNTISGNESIEDGGGIHCYESSPTIGGNTINENSADFGGGIWCHYSSAIISDNTINENSATVGGGGIDCYFSSASISGNTISGNSALWGGGLGCEGDPNAIIISNTIVGNSATYGGGIGCPGATSPTLVNCILWGNTLQQIYGGAPQLSYSDIQGGYTGTGNINSWPAFVDTAQDDYRLQWGSPCIDTGDPNPFYNDPDFTRADMGAWYYDQSMPVRILLTPYNAPIQIPAEGGSFQYAIQATNIESATLSALVWCNVTLPNSGTYGPVLGPVNITLGSGATLSRIRTQVVPAGAPAGMYHYNAYAVAVSDTSEDSFTFTKLGGADWDLGAGGWTNTGEDLGDVGAHCVRPSGSGATPTMAISPNPFNLTTVLSYQLPVAGYVKLEVFDISGRAVGAHSSAPSPLINGWREAGAHQVMYNGSDLPSGIYLARLEAGNFTQTQKLVLLK